MKYKIGDKLLVTGVTHHSHFYWNMTMNKYIGKYVIVKSIVGGNAKTYRCYVSEGSQYWDFMESGLRLANPRLAARYKAKV